jgi:hypothetical protein
MFVGNSIANYDIPMLRRWMPEVTKALSYRTLDVSVLRTFFRGTAKIKLPKDVDDLLSGDTAEETHRALDDCLHCAEALRGLTTYAFNTFVNAYLWFKRAQEIETEVSTVSELQDRVAHLEMLIKYGSRRAIKNERKLVEARDEPVDPFKQHYDVLRAEDNKGLFRASGSGGILGKEVGSEQDDFGPHDPITGHYIGRNGNGR